MPTIQDVAKRAGVGAITVSRVINRSGSIRPETRARVEQAINDLGYVPNTLARSLRSKRTHTIALVLSDITNPFFTTLARGVEDTAGAAGFNVIFCNTDESQEKQATYLNILLQKQVDGFILVPARSDPQPILFIQRQQTPLVIVDRRIDGQEVDTVRCDSVEGSYRLTRHLLELGHRRITLLTGPHGVSTAEDRAAGFSNAMREWGLSLAEDAVVWGEFNADSGYTRTQEKLTQPQRPTALLAANNFITIGAMRALLQAGVRVPEEMALVGFDDLPPAMVTFPFFTVVAQPAYEIGKRATERLLERLNYTGPLPPQEILLPAQLILRQSSGKPVSPTLYE